MTPVTTMMEITATRTSRKKKPSPMKNYIHKKSGMTILGIGPTATTAGLRTTGVERAPGGNRTTVNHNSDLRHLR